MWVSTLPKDPTENWSALHELHALKLLFKQASAIIGRLSSCLSSEAEARARNLCCASCLTEAEFRSALNRAKVSIGTIDTLVEKIDVEVSIGIERKKRAEQRLLEKKQQHTRQKEEQK